MKKYISPTIVEFGNASDLIKGCGGWGCELWMHNHSYRWVGDRCSDYTDGESGEC
ncbi:hypothetical protein [Bacillus sp. 'calajunan']|uniref:hypothetical protein n=1 Tax=Bacillus sp. 'calajunan' TaxID=3447457 RepID=UPI003EE14895